MYDNLVNAIDAWRNDLPFGLIMFAIILICALGVLVLDAGLKAHRRKVIVSILTDDFIKRARQIERESHE